MQPPDSPHNWRSTLARAMVFFAVFAALLVCWDALRGTSIEHLVIHQLTVRPAAFIVNLLTPAAHVRAVDFSLHAPGGGLNILNGCEGMDALFLLIAAFIVAPLSGRERTLGLLFGLGVVFIVNQLRILSLFYAYRADPALFYPLHGTVAPIVVILAVAGYFYVWLYHTAPPPAAAR
jgi:exosortase family protein XrtM